MAAKTTGNMAFLKQKAVVRELPHPAGGNCKLKDCKRRPVDFDADPFRFHQGEYGIGGKVNTKCLINKWSVQNRIDLSGFSIMKNIRNHSIVTCENYYEESGQSRIVLSWVDGSLIAWLKHNGYKKCFKTAVEMRGSYPSRVFRQIIIDTCRALEHLFKEEVYPTAVKQDDLFLCNDKDGVSIKMLISHAECLSSKDAKKQRKTKLWGDLRAIFQDICKKSDLMLTAPAKSFVNYIGQGDVDGLEDFPDRWVSQKKNCYLFSLMAANSSDVRQKLKKMNFGWPRGNSIIEQLLKYERTKDNPTPYDEDDGYDYLRLCRNVVKHWKKFFQNVKCLRYMCASVEVFLRKMEEWTPGIWCILYKAFGWPKR